MKHSSAPLSSYCILALIAVVAYSNAAFAIDHGASDDIQQPKWCGGDLAQGEVARYLDRLRPIINGDRASLRNGGLFWEWVVLIDHGKAITVKRTKLQNFKGRLLTQQDWETIADLLAAGKLESIGWRGCMLSNGKAGFQSDGEGKFGLDAFDFDRAWDED